MKPNPRPNKGTNNWQLQQYTKRPVYLIGSLDAAMPNSRPIAAHQSIFQHSSTLQAGLALAATNFHMTRVLSCAPVFTQTSKYSDPFPNSKKCTKPTKSDQIMQSAAVLEKPLSLASVHRSTQAQVADQPAAPQPLSSGSQESVNWRWPPFSFPKC